MERPDSPGDAQGEAVDHQMRPNDQLASPPKVERRRTRASDEPPLTTLAKLPALRVLQQLPVPVLAVTRDGTIIFANQAFGDMLGYDLETVRTLALAEIFETAAQADCAVSVLREHAGSLVTLSHADGAAIRAIVSKSALQRSDDEIALITFQDLTEQLWLEGR